MNGLRSGVILLVCLASCGESGTPPATSPLSPPRPAPSERNVNPPNMESPRTASPAPVPEGDRPTATPAEPRKKKEAADTQGRAKSPDLFRKYVALMESNGELMESIQADLDAKRYESDVKPKVVKIRKNAESARELHYRKDADQDTALTNDFDLFLFKMKAIEGSPWNEETSSKLLENLSDRCRLCHDTFQ